MKSILIIILYTLSICSSFAKDSTYSSQKIPSVHVKTIDGVSVNILNYIDSSQVTIIFVWETFCKPSIKGLDNIFDLYEEWKVKFNCKLLAISMDDARNSSKIKPFVNGKGWDFTILTDENKDFSRSVNIDACPYILIINKSGEIVYRHFGYVEGMEYEFESELEKFK